MRRYAAALALCLALPAFAQEGQPPRIAFFNLLQLVESSVKAKRVWSELEVAQKNMNEQLGTRGGEYERVVKQLQSGSLSEQGREQLAKQARDMEFELKKLQEDSQRDLRRIQAKVMEELNKQVGPIIDTLAKEQKLQLVLSGEQAGQMLAWADSEWLKAFTSEVAKRLDATEGAAPAKAESKPAAKPAKK